MQYEVTALSNGQQIVFAWDDGAALNIQKPLDAEDDVHLFYRAYLCPQSEHAILNPIWWDYLVENAQKPDRDDRNIRYVINDVKYDMLVLWEDYMILLPIGALFARFIFSYSAWEALLKFLRQER